MSGTFRAWALPPGSDPPPGGSQSMEAGGGRVAHLAAVPDWVGGLAERLREAGAALLEREALDLVRALGHVGDRLLDPEDVMRERALEWLPPTSGLSPPMAAAVLDGMAADWSEDRLRAVLSADLGDARVLDGFRHVETRRVRAFGPDLSFQVVSGSVPGVGVTALIRSLLVKAPVLVKMGRGDVVLPVLAARILQECDPELGAACAAVYWPGGSDDVEAEVLSRADFVAAYGSDDSVSAVRARAPATARVAVYRHRVSLAVVGREALSADPAAKAARELAEAVAMFDQRGCVSPHVVYVEEGGAVSPGEFADLVAERLDALEDRLPSGPPQAEGVARVHQVRGTAELEAAAGGSTSIRHGGARLWTVIYEPDARLEPSCLHRTLRVKAVADALHVAERIRPWRSYAQTVGIVGLGSRVEPLAEALGRAGAVRIAPLRAVPFPEPWWHHDGQGPLSAMLRWVDLVEGG